MALRAGINAKRWYIVDLYNLWKPYAIPWRFISKENVIKRIEKDLNGDFKRFCPYEGAMLITYGIPLRTFRDGGFRTGHEYPVDAIEDQERKSFRTKARRLARGYSNRERRKRLRQKNST